VAEVHTEATAGGDGSYPALRRSLRTSPPDPEPAPQGTWLEGGQADVEDRAEAAVSRGTGSAQPPRGRAVSERRDGEAASGVTRTVRSITTLAVLAVALVAAVASYDHQRALAELAGEGWRAWLLRVSVDGLIVAASMSMLVRRRAQLPAGALAWTSLLAGIGASLAANVAAAAPTLVGRVVAAWPPVALLLAWELLMQVRAPAGTGRSRR
jgi:Protein of unknown function (DUF2637)